MIQVTLYYYENGIGEQVFLRDEDLEESHFVVYSPFPSKVVPYRKNTLDGGFASNAYATDVDYDQIEF